VKHQQVRNCDNIQLPTKQGTTEGLWGTKQAILMLYVLEENNTSKSVNPDND